MARLCGACLALFAFSITVLLGLFTGNPIELILSQAIWALVLFCVIGMCIGWVAGRVLDEHALRRNHEMFKEVEESEAHAESQIPGQEAGGASEASGQTRAEIRGGARTAAPPGAISNAGAPATAGGGPL